MDGYRQPGSGYPGSKSKINYQKGGCRNSLLFIFDFNSSLRFIRYSENLPFLFPVQNFLPIHAGKQVSVLPTTTFFRFYLAGGTNLRSHCKGRIKTFMITCFKISQKLLILVGDICIVFAGVPLLYFFSKYYKI